MKGIERKKEMYSNPIFSTATGHNVVGGKLIISHENLRQILERCTAAGTDECKEIPSLIYLSSLYF